MDYDKIASLLKDENVAYAEVSRFKKKSDGSVVIESVYVDYFSKGDYHWTISEKPIFLKDLPQ